MGYLFSYLGIAAVWVGFLSLAALFFCYRTNKEKYEKIIKLHYEKGFSFYGPYHFHSLMGFFGSFTIIYYFICIKNKKKPLLMPCENNEIYKFFDDIPANQFGWMTHYYRGTLFILLCIAFMLLMAAMKYIYSH